MSWLRGGKEGKGACGGYVVMRTMAFNCKKEPCVACVQDAVLEWGVVDLNTARECHPKAQKIPPNKPHTPNQTANQEIRGWHYAKRRAGGATAVKDNVVASET
jgi:hypothetical protein